MSMTTERPSALAQASATLTSAARSAEIRAEHTGHAQTLPQAITPPNDPDTVPSECVTCFNVTLDWNAQ
ncbi:MAG: hypothetical protein LC676_07225 [Loktanella sp.]|nr:hypothetical protein [Loktanella sp.]